MKENNIPGAEQFWSPNFVSKPSRLSTPVADPMICPRREPEIQLSVGQIKPSTEQIGLETNRAVVAEIHDDSAKRAEAIRNLADLLASADVESLNIFIQVQKRR
jgi:hypothetical protein